MQTMTDHSPLPPKILDWERQLPQLYHCHYDVLITAGCSFAASTKWLDGPASWPGFVRDRCGIPVCVDLSYPGAGNEYIANSVLAHIEEPVIKGDNILVLVGWSGLNRKEELVFSTDCSVLNIDQISYRRNRPPKDSNLNLVRSEVWRSWKNIIFTKNYLENKRIAHGFFSYCNLMEPPFLPKRDLTPEWPGSISQSRMNSLRRIPWLVPHKQSLFEFAFENDSLAEDLFHPNLDGTKLWTDQVLLPNMAQQGLIRSI